MLALGEVRGTNQDTSASDFFAGASAVNVETADLMQGNGTHQGYYTMRNAGDAVTAKWQGTVTILSCATPLPIAVPIAMSRA